MTRDRGERQGPPSPLRAANRGGGGGVAAAAADAVGSSTKDRGWQQRRLAAGSRLGPQSDRKKSKKVEGTVVAAAGPPPSRIPAGPGHRPAPQQQQQQAPPSTGGSRIPRPPLFGGGASPQTDLVAALATPAAPGLLEELHAPAGFHSYANPLAATPAAAVAATGPDGTRLFVNGLAEVEAEAVAATPGLLDPAALTPNTERSLQAWLRASPSARPQGSVRAGSVPPATGGATSGLTNGKVLPTPEAWQMLQHINADSPPAPAPQGVHGLMNAYLRTGPQVLSPEPAAIGGMIRAPGAAAVPASGLLAVAGPGGVGVYGMVKGAAAYLRTGAHQLSPEPGMEGQHAASPPPPPAALPHPYSPASPLAATPAGPASTTPAGPSGSGIALSRRPTSVCSNGEVGSCGPAGSISLGGAPSPAPFSGGPPSVPRLNLSALRQQQEGGTDGTEVSFGAVLAPAAAAEQQEQPDSPAADELPTARFSPAASPAAGAVQDEAAAAPSEGQAPSAITFALPAEAPSREPVAAAAPASNSPTFSFGFGAAPAAAAQAVPEAAGEGPPAAAAAVAAGHVVPGAAAPVPAALPRNDSGETIQQPNPFEAMLHHLRGPQYASPARFALRGRAMLQLEQAESPQSPKELTPLHLISITEGSTSPTARMATPAPGQGSLTVWMDRRGMRRALSTPARNDLRVLWAAAREVAACKSETAALRASNAALLEQLEVTQSALQDLGVEHGAAVVAAEAGALCAEAELARARDAAGHMMSLADQIQGLFALCESEKNELVAELDAARDKLAASEAAAADTASLSNQQQAQLAGQLEEARQAVAAAQTAADAAQQRASAAGVELESIRSQLAAAQEQLAAEEAAAAEQQQQTPLGKLRLQLGGLHESLAQLHAEHCAGRLQASTPELDQLLEASRAELAQVEQLLGGDAAALRLENQHLHRCLAQARSLLAENSPAPLGGSDAAAACGTEQREDGSSPLPFALFGRPSSDAELVGGDFSPATTISLVGAGGCASPDVFSSPFLASQTTLTVDYRSLQQATPSSSCRQGSPTTPGSAASSPADEASGIAASPAVPSSCGTNSASSPLQTPEQQPAGDQQQQQAAGEGEEEVTVVHNGMVITNVPASEVSKVKSMVQYWEAVASGTPLPAVSAEEAAAAEAYANAAIAAAEAAMAAAAALAEEQQQQQQQQQVVDAPAGELSSPAPEAAAAEVQLEAERSSSRLPATQLGTPVGSTGALAVTPLALSALRARLGGSAGGVQDAVRSRLARLKADLAAAQAKLATVDQGLASIALTPTSSIAASGTPGSRASSLLRRTPLTPSTAGTAAGSGSGALFGSPLPRGSPASPLHELSLSSSRATALIAAGGASPLAPAGDSLVGVTQPAPGWHSPAAAAAGPQLTLQQAAMEVQDSAPAPSMVECTPPVTRRSVRFADTVQPGSSSRARLRIGTPYSAAAAFDLEAEEEEEAVASTASPVVASCRRSPLGRVPAGASPLPAAAWQRSPLAPMQSAAKPRHGGAAYDSDAGSSEDDEAQLFDASRMAQRAQRALGPTPSPLRLAGSAADATPMAHPEPAWGAFAGEDDEDAEEGQGCGYPAPGSIRRGGTPATSMLSTSSFSPPRPLVLLAVRPLGRSRRGGLLRGTGRQPRSEAEEREFRRRAAALNIAISPYFRRGGTK
ncbi:hypothetical protein C2E21_1411 [Chlorella sorokiniana]|uniref:Uncharacterized protein n=1 Tax=Chlorella sorokiniana TaxID=3076 RepID=A0A2P6TZL9_CHLSO|nr:hypothetical protein C2E21_1411 [Chlorella sorokiniana]|eukprot:PRW59511.1 hypothetical protein C2E21_1411 [Chlorella sorokiniana]